MIKKFVSLKKIQCVDSETLPCLTYHNSWKLKTCFQQLGVRATNLSPLTGVGEGAGWLCTLYKCTLASHRLLTHHQIMAPGALTDTVTSGVLKVGLQYWMKY